MPRNPISIAFLIAALLSGSAFASPKLTYKVFNASSDSSNVWVGLSQFDEFSRFDHSFTSPNTIDYDLVIVILDSWEDGSRLRAEERYPISEIVAELTKGYREDAIVTAELPFSSGRSQLFLLIGNSKVSDFCLSKYVVDTVNSKRKYINNGEKQLLDVAAYTSCNSS